MNTIPRKIIVIGGGPAGMVAAIAAARQGFSVQILERMQRVGKKLLATGNGRCNLTNSSMDIHRFHGSNPEFAQSALQQFDVSKTLSFFEELGVLTREEEDGKIFPITDQASSVLDVLRFELEHLGIETVPETNINHVALRGNGFECTSTDGRKYQCGKVIIAAGGKSSPNLGSNGGGFKIAETLGHGIIPPIPALVQLRLDAPFLKHLQGIKVVDGETEIQVDGNSRGSTRGELLFTDYGISGPPILSLSRAVSQLTEVSSANYNVSSEIILHLNLFPEKSNIELESLIRQRISFHPEKTIENCFVGLLHKRIAGVLLRQAGVEDMLLQCGTLSDQQIGKISLLLKDWPIRCMGVQSWMHSQVTAGGVDVREVNAETMESKIVPNLFFAGEVLDIDGDSGGYNLQWAWSSGYVAGLNAAM